MNQFVLERIGKLFYKGKLLIPSAVLFIVFSLFSFKTINYPTILIFLLPFLVALYSFFFDWRSNDKKKRYISKGGNLFFDFIVHFFHSLWIFGIGLYVVIHSANLYLTKNSLDEITQCKISSLFDEGDESTVGVYWHDQEIFLPINQSMIYSINESNSKFYKLELATCDGILGTVVIKSFVVIKN